MESNSATLKEKVKFLEVMGGRLSYILAHGALILLHI